MLCKKEVCFRVCFLAFLVLPLSRFRLAVRLHPTLHTPTRRNDVRYVIRKSALSDLSGKWVDRVQRLRGSPNLILDIDSSESPVHGEQEASAYNGHFGCSCYHPLFVFNQHCDLEDCSLRPGNVHSADNWKAVLDPVVQRYRWTGLWRKYLRGDAAFAIPE